MARGMTLDQRMDELAMDYRIARRQGRVRDQLAIADRFLGDDHWPLISRTIDHARKCWTGERGMVSQGAVRSMAEARRVYATAEGVVWTVEELPRDAA